MLRAIHRMRIVVWMMMNRHDPIVAATVSAIFWPVVSCASAARSPSARRLRRSARSLLSSSFSSAPKPGFASVPSVIADLPRTSARSHAMLCPERGCLGVAASDNHRLSFAGGQYERRDRLDVPRGKAGPRGLERRAHRLREEQIRIL